MSIIERIASDRELAAEMTPGRRHSDGVQLRHINRGVIATFPTPNDGKGVFEWMKNRDGIARFADPATVTQLLDIVEAAQEVLTKDPIVGDKWHRECWGCGIYERHAITCLYVKLRATMHAYAKGSA